jgi:splicing factor U2AF subunit
MTIQADPLCKVPSRVLQFLNMFYPEDLYDDEFYDDLHQDLKEECEKYGPVEQIVVPKPNTKCGYAVPSIGKAFVKFMYIIHAKRARLGLAGRVYNKRTVLISFYPEEKFSTKEYLVSVS